MALPQGWVQCSLVEANVVIAGQSPESKYYNETGVGLPFFQGKADFGQLHPTNRVFCTDPKKVAVSGDILLSVRAPVGPTNLAKETVAIGRGLNAIRPLGGILTKYVLYYFKQIEPVFSGQGTGTTFSAVTVDDVKNLSFPLSPLAEQHRIVAKIDALFSELDKGVEMLQTVRAQLRTYRQAVLKWAFTGQLVRKDWSTSSIGAIAEEIKIGPFGTLLHKEDYVYGGLPIVNPKHMSNYRIQSETSKTVSVEKAEELSSYTIHENDVLIARRGEMGRTAYVTQKEDGWLCGTGSMIIRFPKIYRGYLYAMLLSAEQPRKYLVDKSNGTTMDNLNEIIIKRLPFPAIPVDEQKYVLSEIESRLSVCDKLEQLVDENLGKAQALRQSILKKAFAGELVPQDPSDEPAEKLLERIKAMKATATKTTTAGRARK